MPPVIRIELDPDSQALILRQREAAAKLPEALTGALREGLTGMEDHLVADYLTGGDWQTPRHGSLPLAVRTGDLREAVTSEVDQPLSGYVGTKEGPASNYAAVQLGPDLVTIVPKKAKHLWVPVGPALTPSGAAKISPTALMALTDEKGKRAVRFFRSKSGNLVAFLPGRVTQSEDRSKDVFTPGEKRKRASGGHAKGTIKGNVFFVLKDSAEVQGTDALARSVDEGRERLGVLLDGAVKKSLGEN